MESVLQDQGRTYYNLRHEIQHILYRYLRNATALREDARSQEINAIFHRFKDELISYSLSLESLTEYADAFEVVSHSEEYARLEPQTAQAVKSELLQALTTCLLALDLHVAEQIPGTIVQAKNPKDLVQRILQPMGEWEAVTEVELERFFPVFKNLYQKYRAYGVAIRAGASDFFSQLPINEETVDLESFVFTQLNQCSHLRATSDVIDTLMGFLPTESLQDRCYALCEQWLEEHLPAELSAFTAEEIGLIAEEIVISKDLNTIALHLMGWLIGVLDVPYKDLKNINKAKYRDFIRLLRNVPELTHVLKSLDPQDYYSMIYPEVFDEKDDNFAHSASVNLRAMVEQKRNSYTSFFERLN